MRLSEFTVFNFRSINELRMKCGSMATLIGPNNHGKSNVLSALEFGFSTASKPRPLDFFEHGKKEMLFVEMTFHNLTEQEKVTFNKYVGADGMFSVRKTATLRDGTVETLYNGYVEEPEESWLRADSVSELTNREAASSTPLYPLLPVSGRLTRAIVEDAQQKFMEAHRPDLKVHRILESSSFLGQKNVGGGVLPELFLIPAVKDLSDEVKFKTTTTFGRLLGRAVREMAERDQRFIEAKSRLEELVKSLTAGQGTSRSGVEGNELLALERRLEDELKGWNVSVKIDVAPPDIEKLFELGSDLLLDDGIRTSAERKGHGLQRAVIFALIKAWAAVLQERPKGESDLSARRQSSSAIFAMEEPELFLHPHAQRRMAASLRQIAETPDHQVLLCTHSTHFVDLEHYKEIVIVKKGDAVVGSEAMQVVDDLFPNDDQGRRQQFHMAQWINPDRAEIFFARKAVFVEGSTEKVAIPYVAKRLGVGDLNVSIVDCGSKFNLPLYVALANAFQIPYVVVHDEDPLPEPIPPEWNEDKIREKRRTFAYNEQIAAAIDQEIGKVAILAPDLERLIGVSGNQADRKGKPLAAIEHLASIETNDFPDALVKAVRESYG